MLRELMAGGEASGVCPYCGEPVEIWVDGGGGGRQRFVEDCAVCCRPIDVRVGHDEDGEPIVDLRRGDD